MAALPETPFALLLRADSEQTLPDSDADVIAALTTYGAVFSKVKKLAPERLDLLAGLMWVHMHQLDLHAVWPAASVAQHKVLAKALRLDYDAHAASAPWLTMVVRKVLASSVPGSTPQKRPAPGPSVDGQIKIPGSAAGDSADPPSPKKRRGSKAAKAAAKSKKDSSSSSGDSSSSSSDGGVPAPTAVDLTSSAPSGRMPAALERGPTFAALVAARCRRSWLPTAAFESEVPTSYRSHLFRGKMWDNADRKRYDRMISSQDSSVGKSQRRENPAKVAFPHRLTFAYSNDAEQLIEAQHLVMMCAGESLSDFSGSDGSAFGDRRGRANYVLLVNELRDAWSNLTGAVERNENVGAPTVTAIFDLVYVFLERRYERCSLILSPGRLREEVLANVARQLAELRQYFADFQRNLSDRCSRKLYAELAQFTGSRYLALLGPTVLYLLDADGGPGFGAVTAPAPPATPAPLPARRKLTVSFADGGLGEPQTQAAPAPLSPPPANIGSGGWPGVPHYATYPAAYYPPQGVSHTPPPGFNPFNPAGLSPPAPAGWSGYSGPVPASSPAPPAPPARAAIKAEPLPGREPFLGQPQHIYITGEGYNAVPPGEQRTPPCGCPSKHGPAYLPGPHATWDCPFRYMLRCGSCPGFLPSGQKDPAQWTGDRLTARARQSWVKLIKDFDLPLPNCTGAKAPNFSL